jgi:hypothetical protein
MAFLLRRLSLDRLMLVACRLWLPHACRLTLDAPAPSVSSGALRNILDDTTFFSPIDLKNLSQLRTYDAGSCSLDLIKYHIKLFLVIRISVYHMQRLELTCPNTLCSLYTHCSPVYHRPSPDIFDSALLAAHY